MTTFENVSYGPKVQRKLSKDVYVKETMKLLELVGLKDFKDKYPRSFRAACSGAPNWSGP